MQKRSFINIKRKPFKNFLSLKTVIIYNYKSRKLVYKYLGKM